MAITAKFTCGQFVATPGAVAAFSASDPAQGPFFFLTRHLSGDWGEVDEHDWKANDEALEEDGRLLSVYTLMPTGTRIYLITEADRSVTTVLLPEEY